MLNSHKILVTGSKGFIGSHLCAYMEKQGAEVTKVVRSALPHENGFCVIGDIQPNTNWLPTLKDQNIVIHTAALTHSADNNETTLALYKNYNVAATLNLAKQAAEAGVKRFIFISSIKVNGEQTLNTAFNEETPPNPSDAYGVSKYEAEKSLIALSVNTSMEVVIIRPPLVYGSDVKANFRSLLKLAKSGIPLPFGSINNARSMIYVKNLVAFITLCIDNPKAANQLFLVSDQQDTSLPQLIKLIRISMGLKPRIFKVPLWVFHLVGKLTGKNAAINRLLGSLQIDSSKATRVLEWKPPFTIESGVQETALAFLNEKKND